MPQCLPFPLLLEEGADAGDGRGYEVAPADAAGVEAGGEDAGRAGLWRMCGEDEVAEAPGEEAASAELDRLENMWVRAENDRRAGVERRCREVRCLTSGIWARSVPQWK